MTHKTTPPCCKVKTCEHNLFPPPFNSQECIGCPYLKNKDWRPTQEHAQ